MTIFDIFMLPCRIQEEREERHKYKGVVKSALEEPETTKGIYFFDDFDEIPCFPCQYRNFLFQALSTLVIRIQPIYTWGT